jgi:hypothetical protein
MYCSDPPPSFEVLGGGEHVNSTDIRINKILRSYSLMEAPLQSKHLFQNTDGVLNNWPSIFVLMIVKRFQNYAIFSVLMQGHL